MIEVAVENRMLWAAWKSMDTGLLAFAHDWESRRLPVLWWGEDRIPLKRIRRLQPIEYGWHGHYYGEKDLLHFVLPAEAIRKGPVYVAGTFNGWEVAKGDPDWRMELKSVAEKRCYHLSIKRSLLPEEEPSLFKFITEAGDWVDVPESAPNLQIDDHGFKNFLLDPRRTGKHLFEIQFPLPLTQSEGRQLYLETSDDVFQSMLVRPGVFLKSLQTDHRLGCWVKQGDTYFALFAPRAESVTLYLQETLDADPSAVELELDADMVWKILVEGDFSGWYYYYKVRGESTEDGAAFNEKIKVLDPYALAAAGPAGPGIIIDPESIRHTGPRFQPPAWHDLVIAEAHVRDLVANAPIPLSEDERQGYRGLEKWIREDSFYLTQLGVNAVELQPIQLFDEADAATYAWGYMPINYFSPATQYARNPAKGSQIKEFKRVVSAFHDKGMAVLVDVVYNHVGEPNFLQYLDKAYYFLLTEDGHYENHSGCGNTIDANTPMVRRLIRDSLVHLIECYDVDGFRFDLGELIGKETLAWLEAELKQVKPGVILIAEPWSFRGHIGEQLRETGFASWNDGYRERIREYVLDAVSADALPYFMRGSFPTWSRFPAQTVNYVESHDDRCWIDKITEQADFNGSWPTVNDIRRTHLMIGMLMSSVGIPMIASGIDMLKSKGGVNNTYLRGDLNALNYERAQLYSGTVQYIRAWIRFRLSKPGRLLRLDRMPSKSYLKDAVSGQAYALLFNADHTLGQSRLLFAVNSGFNWAEVVMSGELFSAMRQIGDTERFDQHGLKPPIYAVGKDRIKLPPLSCGLWMED